MNTYISFKRNQKSLVIENDNVQQIFLMVSVQMFDEILLTAFPYGI